MKLTYVKIKHAKPKAKDYKLSDGKGLYLLVTKTGRKYWRFKYHYGGKEKKLAIGVYPEVSLKQAREDHIDARRLLAQHIDPSEQKRLNKIHQNQLAANSFELVAREWLAKKSTEYTKDYAKQVERLLENWLFPKLGHRPIANITTPELLRALQKAEAQGIYEIVHRLRQKAGQIFRYAVVTCRAERDIAADLKDALITPKKGHYAAITNPKELGKLLIDMENYAGSHTVRAALRLSPLVFVRPGELRHMEKTEINWEEALWEIPSEKMKRNRDHIVPLSKQAIAILKQQLYYSRNSRYIFPSARGTSRPLSENGVRVALRTMGYDNDTMTGHGFRATARTILDEVLELRIDWIEHQLAHTVKDPNGRAYNRTKHLPQRREMMQRWADYLDVLKGQAKQ